MIVRKYGGSSLVSAEQIHEICIGLPSTPLVLVLSAAQGRTNELYNSADGLKSCERNHHLALGEFESCMRVWLKLDQLGREAEVIPYKRAGICASKAYAGDIVDCDPAYIQSVLDKGIIAIVPGFQGIYEDSLAILKRGSSDDTAVMLAAKLGARCEMYSNVPYIYDENQSQLHRISYLDISRIVGNGSAPISQGAIRIARENDLAIHFRRWCATGQGTLICNDV